MIRNNSNTTEGNMNNQLKQLNDELTNCRKAISQALVLSGSGVLPRLRRMENNIILDIQKLAIKFPFIKSTTEKIIENRGWQTKIIWYNKSITNNNIKEKNMTNKLQQLNDELANCRKAISQSVVLSDQSMALRKIENNIISDIQKQIILIKKLLKR